MVDASLETGGWLHAKRERTEEGIDLRLECPKAGASVSISVCDLCPSALALATDERGAALFVRCGLSAPTPRPDQAVGPVLEETAQQEKAPRIGRDAMATPVTAIMRRTVAVTDGALPAEQLAESLVEEGIGGAPVVDDEGRLRGIVSKTDLLRFWRELATPQRDGRVLTAEDVMMPAVYTLHPDSTIAEAAALMAYEGVHRLPIIDDEGRVVGLVSTLDITRWVAQSAGFHAPAFGPSRSLD